MFIIRGMLVKRLFNFLLSGDLVSQNITNCSVHFHNKLFISYFSHISHHVLISINCIKLTPQPVHFWIQWRFPIVMVQIGVHFIPFRVILSRILVQNIPCTPQIMVGSIQASETRLGQLPCDLSLGFGARNCKLRLISNWWNVIPILRLYKRVLFTSGRGQNGLTIKKSFRPVKFFLFWVITQAIRETHPPFVILGSHSHIKVQCGLQAHQIVPAKP